MTASDRATFTLLSDTSTAVPSTDKHRQQTAGSTTDIHAQPLNRKGYRNKQSIDYIYKTLLAGGLAGCAAKTVIAPLDRVKILFQTSNPAYEKYAGSFSGTFKALGMIRRTQGILGLFQGHSATLLRIFPYAAIKFMTYEQLKARMMPTKRDETALRKFLAGSIAGCASVFCSYPLDILRVRMAFDVRLNRPPSGLFETARAIYFEPSIFFPGSKKVYTPFTNIFNFYRGFIPTIYGMIPYAGVSFLTYETLKTYTLSHFEPYTLSNWEIISQQRQGAHDAQLKQRDPACEEWGKDTRSTIRKEDYTNEVYSNAEYQKGTIKPTLNAMTNLTIGGMSGILAQTFSYPLEVIRRHMQVSARSALGQAHTTTLRTIKDIWGRKGIRGFWVGLSIGYIKVTPMFAVSFYTYEWLKIELEID
ncbi:hypothetical protein BASA81_015507 [Batrachochytrium salamandrivorans]|nr:hypothetical protein BASA81_015507 [Batrachochytrium salamandrivorans]